VSHGAATRAPAVFLDRDGVLNAAVVRDGRPYPPQTEADVQLLPGVADACRALAGAGLKLVCVSNQPDIARGTQSATVVADINAHLQRLLDLDEIVVCPHDDGDGCACRKPLAGMLFTAAERMNLDLVRSVTVGDRWRDVEAGRTAGTLTVFIDRGYRERAPDGADLIVGELEEAVEWIISKLHT
jgi:D-glycero-D-manno-heptose 1,7-bisphosphate phosphatase